MHNAEIEARPSKALVHAATVSRVADRWHWGMSDYMYAMCQLVIIQHTTLEN